MKTKIQIYDTYRRVFYDDCLGFLNNCYLDRTAQKKINAMDDMRFQSWIHL